MCQRRVEVAGLLEGVAAEVEAIADLEVIDLKTTDLEVIDLKTTDLEVIDLKTTDLKTTEPAGSGEVAERQCPTERRGKM